MIVCLITLINVGYLLNITFPSSSQMSPGELQERLQSLDTLLYDVMDRVCSTVDVVLRASQAAEHISSTAPELATLKQLSVLR